MRGKTDPHEKRIFSRIKKGALKRQLGISASKRVPKTLLMEIMRSRVGETIRNPTETGERRIKVTGLLKRRANVALRWGYKDWRKYGRRR